MPIKESAAEAARYAFSQIQLQRRGLLKYLDLSKLTRPASDPFPFAAASSLSPVLPVMPPVIESFLEMVSYSLDDFRGILRILHLGHFAHMNVPAPKSKTEGVSISIGNVIFLASVTDYGTQFYGGDVAGAPNFLADVSDALLLESGFAREESRCAMLCLAVGSLTKIHPFLLLAAIRFVATDLERYGCQDAAGAVDFGAKDVLSSFTNRANELDLHILTLIDFDEFRDRTVIGE